MNAMPKSVTLTIDGQEVTVPEGTTILEAARGLEPALRRFSGATDEEGREETVECLERHLADGRDDHAGHRGRLRRPDVVPLRVLDADLREAGQHLGGVHALGDGADAHGLADLRDRAHQAAVDVVVRHVVHELPVELQEVHGKVLQEDER